MNLCEDLKKALFVDFSGYGEERKTVIWNWMMEKLEEDTGNINQHFRLVAEMIMNRIERKRLIDSLNNIECDIMVGFIELKQD